MKKIKIDMWDAPWILQFIWFFPIMVAVLPIPLLIPGTIIAMVIDQPEEWPLIPIYFGWLSISLFIAHLEDKTYNN